MKKLQKTKLGTSLLIAGFLFVPSYSYAQVTQVTPEITITSQNEPTVTGSVSPTMGVNTSISPTQNPLTVTTSPLLTTTVTPAIVAGTSNDPMRGSGSLSPGVARGSTDDQYNNNSWLWFIPLLLIPLIYFITRNNVNRSEVIDIRQPRVGMKGGSTSYNQTTSDEITTISDTDQKLK